VHTSAVPDSAAMSHPTLLSSRGSTHTAHAAPKQPAETGIAGSGVSLAVALLGFFVVTLDALVVNVALPAKGDPRMAAWTNDELTRIGAADELELAPLRLDGTLRKPVTIWVVRVGDDLYVRSWRGRTGAWFRAAQVRHAGRIWAGGVTKDVTFIEETDPAINDQIDTAYRAKYRRYGARYVDPMVAPEARAATLKLVPCS
jgi:hypothetical protein